MNLTDDRVITLLIDDGQPQRLWAGTMSGGINVIEHDKVVRTFSHDPENPDSISSNAISKLYRDNEGRIWVATYGEGLDLYEGDGRFKHYPESGRAMGDFSDLRLADIIEVDKGIYWLATNGGGIVVLDSKTGYTYAYEHDSHDPGSLSSNNVITLLKTSNAVWAGTRDRGVNRFDPATRTFRRYTKSDGLASDAVFGMLADAKGRIWISGAKGLSVLDPRTGNFTNYDSTHGLQNDDFTGGAYLKLSDGSFLFGGNNGFNAFEPTKIRRNTHVPIVEITRFTKFNKPVELPRPVYQTKSVEVDYGDSVIGFEFAAMDFTAPQKNRYQYKLEGFDRDWVNAGSTRQATYTNLDPGEYTFRVRASNNDGVWSETLASVGVKVNPPIWATWWAYLGYLVLGLFVLYQAQKANGRRLRREAEKRYSERLQLYIESLEEATDCVLIADANKNLMYANNAIKSILGLSPSEAVGKSIFSLLFSNANDAELARQGLNKEGRWHGEV